MSKGPAPITRRRPIDDLGPGLAGAPVAVTSAGTVLRTVARFHVPKRIEEIVRVAVSQRGAVFIGVALSAAEARRLLDEIALILPNATGPLVGRRQRRVLRHRSSR